jgi:transcriptional regulator with XRE-family HTH domain
MNTFGNILKELRLKKGLNQVELAKILSVAKGTISNWEKGNRTPDNEMLSKIATFFDVTVDFLLGREIKILTSNEPELSVHQKLALELASILEKDGYVYSHDKFQELITFSKYALSQNKKNQDD